MPISINGSTGISGVDGSAGTPALQGSDSNTGIAFGADTIIGSTGGSERFRVDSNGRLGIGTTSPQKTLSVSKAGAEGVEWNPGQSSNVNTEVHYNRSGSAFCGLSTQAAYHVFDLASSEAARIDSSGRLLVGTSSGTGNSGTRLVLHDSSSPRLRFTNSTTGETASDGGEISLDGSNLVIENRESAATIFYTSGSARMRVDSNGRLLINTTSPVYDGRLCVEENADTVRNVIAANNIAPGSGSSGFIAFYRNSTYTGGISNTNNTTAYNTSSDYRLKENVIAVTDGIVRLQQLKPCRFNFITDPDRTVDGFLAHEVQDVIPEVIHGEKDAVDKNGNPIYQGIDQSKLVPLLTAALQEAIAKIESLETRLAALEVT